MITFKKIAIFDEIDWTTVTPIYKHFLKSLGATKRQLFDLQFDLLFYLIYCKRVVSQA